MSQSSYPIVALIVQARMGASRLPGKPLLQVLDKPLLAYLIERLKRVKRASKLVIATTENENDLPIVTCGKNLSVDVFRGSENDVLSRYLAAAREMKADIIVRITADCPLIDPVIIDDAIHGFLQGSCDYFSNVLKRTFPRGMDVEVFSRKALEEANLKAKLPSEREHVTLYIYRHPEHFQIKNFEREKDDSHLRLTVDTQEDFILIEKMIHALYRNNPHFGLVDMLDLLKKHPDWILINQHIAQKEV